MINLNLKTDWQKEGENRFAYYSAITRRKWVVNIVGQTVWLSYYKPVNVIKENVKTTFLKFFPVGELPSGFKYEMFLQISMRISELTWDVLNDFIINSDARYRST